MTSTQEPNTMAPQSALRIFSEKLIIPIYLKTKTSSFVSQLISFSVVTGVRRVKFRFGIISSDRVRSTTVNSLLKALRAISNISSDNGKDFFADELLVY